ncbi:hypothetical protein Droror1_Dr00025593 [Drosera rotundifolia]
MPANGPRPRYPRVKTRRGMGTVSKSLKLVECVKGLSNLKEEVYGALDAFVAWELEFPLVIVKKALKMLEYQREWKRVIQLTKWMLSKGQGKTMGTYYTLLYALAEEDRLEEVEDLWRMLLKKNLEGISRIFFDKMIGIYYSKGMHEKMFDVFADMEELSIRPTMPIVFKVGTVFLKLKMMDKYQKLHKKYPPPRWEYKYFKGKRVRVRAKQPDEWQESDQDVHELQELRGESSDASEVVNEYGRTSNEQSTRLLEDVEGLPMIAEAKNLDIS